MKEKLKNILRKAQNLYYKIRPENGWLSSKKLLIALSLAASVGCWIFVTLYVNADSQKTLTDVPIRIDTSAPGEFGLEMISITAPDALSDGRIDVNVTGSAYQISRVTSDDVTVVAQTSSVNKAGEYALSLVLTCSNRDVAVSLKDGYKSVSVWFDSIKQKSVTLERPSVSGVTVPADSGFIVGDPTGFVKVVNISGPESVIDRIAAVQLRAEVNRELSATTTVEGTICYLDENGELLGSELTDYITILDYNDIEATEGIAAGAPAPADCTISVPIRMECELQIVPLFRNIPEGFDESKLSYTLSQDTIRLEGDIDVMKKYSEDGVFSLDGIDMSVLTPENRSFVIKLNLSSAVYSADGITEITVDVDMTRCKETVHTVSRERVAIINGPETGVSVASETVDITVVGPRDVVDKLNERNFTVLVDMTDDELTAGVREKNATVLISDADSCWTVGTYSVRVRVE